MEIASNFQPHQHPASMNPSRLVENDMPIPRSPTSATAANALPSRRHAKGLSLNFPILLPTNVQFSQSPTTCSGVPSPIESARSSPSTRAAPFRSPDTSFEPQDSSKTKGSSEFLTLLAGQERKVLELREELQRAETDLLTLKKQWATYEANKKRDELRQVKKLQPMALDDVAGSETSVTEEELDEERRRKRVLVERSYANQAATANNGGSGLSRKGSKRVFEGSRHTRTLSLLSPTSTKAGVKQAEDVKLAEDYGRDADSEDGRRPSLSRMPTLDGLISGEALPLGFGKTYKGLAAHRRSLPPVAADMLVKQGKQVYDGVREGLWTFFEDIRQATVGEEGISGTGTQQRPPRQTQRKASRKSSERAGKRNANGLVESSNPGSKEASFWKEFGLDTPQRTASTQSKTTEKSNGHVQQKSSTDSTNPPSLLPDLNDNDEFEDGWDAWESPVSNKVLNVATAEETKDRASDAEGGLPGPRSRE